jgi:hypothetical protein
MFFVPTSFLIDKPPVITNDAIDDLGAPANAHVWRVKNRKVCVDTVVNSSFGRPTPKTNVFDKTWTATVRRMIRPSIGIDPSVLLMWSAG